MTNTQLPVAIIGGGPVGLAAAAHLLKNNQAFILFESEKSIGANILSWGHVKVFSPWKYNIDNEAEKLLRNAGHAIPDKSEVPYGQQIVEEYLRPLSQLAGIKENIHLNTKVLAVGRKGLDKMKNAGRTRRPFSIQVNENGVSKIYDAKAVIDASGTWQNPNPVGSGGVFTIGEKENEAHFYYGMPDVVKRDMQRYADKTVLVVGGGHSAIGTVLALNDLQDKHPNTTIHWLLRKNHVSKVYGGQEADGFKSRGELGIRIEKLVDSGKIKVHTPVFIHQFEKTGQQLKVYGMKNNQPFSLIGIDEVISNTGTRPDFSFLREVRIDVDAAIECVPELAELIDPNIHSCGTVRPHGEAELRQPEKGFYIVGMKSYGRAPTFLMATGYEQIRSIVAYMNGDFEGAKDVRLELPETGVCSTDLLDKNCCTVEDEDISTLRPVDIANCCNSDINESVDNSCCSPALEVVENGYDSVSVATKTNSCC